MAGHNCKESLVSFLIAFTIGAALHRLLSALLLTVTVVATFPPGEYTGEYIELFVNERWSDSLRLPIQPGVRSSYAFPGLPWSIRQLRIDSAESLKSTTLIHSVEVSFLGKTLRTFTPAELSIWTMHGATGSVSADRDSLVLSPTRDPFLYSQVDIELIPFGIARVSDLLFGRVGLLALLTVLGSFLLLSARGVLFTALITGGIASIYGLLAVIIHRAQFSRGPLDSVERAVGNSNFLGTSKQLEIATYGKIVLIVAVISLTVYFLARILSRLSDYSVEPEIREARATIPALAALSCTIVVFALLIFPPLSRIISQSSTIVHDPHFDRLNMVIWSYFLHLNAIPFRDLWYPYGGFFFAGLGTEIPDRTALVFGYGHRLLIFTMFLTTSAYIFRFSVPWILSTIALLTSASLLGILVYGERYLLPLTLTLLLFCVLERRSRALATLFALFALYVAFMELPQLVYALPALGILIIIAIHSAARDHADRQTVRVIATMLGVILCLGIAAVAALSYQDLLQPILSFYQSLGEQRIYTSVPSGIQTWYSDLNTVENWLAILVLVLFGFSLTLALSSCSDRSHLSYRSQFLTTLPLAISLSLLMMFMKQVVRPHSAFQLLGVTLLGYLYLLYASGVNRSLSIRSRMGLGIAAGFVVSFVLLLHRSVHGHNPWNGQPIVGKPLISIFSERVRNISNDLQALVAAPEVWKNAERDYFRSGSFEHPVIAALREAQSDSAQSKVFVLGDQPGIYPALSELPPPHICLYSQSPIEEQLRTIQWLDSTKPEFVVWDNAGTEFDGVPNYVRTPLLYTYVIEHYAFWQRTSGVVILRPRKPDEVIDTNFWRAFLGTEIHFGYIPSRSEVARYPEARSDAASAVLEIFIPHPIEGSIRTVPLHVEGFEYTLRFNEREGVNNYAINLARVWFSRIAGQAGEIPASEDKTLNKEIKFREIPELTLY